MSDYDSQIEEWLVLAKGGPGSGEHPGHPFRGNGTTGGVPQARNHDNPEGEKSWSHGQHLDAASSHMAAAQAALMRGSHGVAMRHFNTAARHYSWAAARLNTNGADPMLHQTAKTGYAAAHHAGDTAEIANKDVRAYASALRSGADAHTLSLLAMKAQTSHSEAVKAATTAMNNESEIGAHRMSAAISGAIPQAESA